MLCKCCLSDIGSVALVFPGSSIVDDKTRVVARGVCVSHHSCWVAQAQQLPYVGHVISPHAGGDGRPASNGAGALYGAPQPHLDRQLEAELQRQQQEQAVLQQHLVRFLVEAWVSAGAVLSSVRGADRGQACSDDDVQLWCFECESASGASANRR